jgi:hypothetical protein
VRHYHDFACSAITELDALASTLLAVEGGVGLAFFQAGEERGWEECLQVRVGPGDCDAPVPGAGVGFFFEDREGNVVLRGRLVGLRGLMEERRGF